MGLYRCVGRLVHGGHAGAVKTPWIPLDVALEWDRSDRRLEVEEALCNEGWLSFSVFLNFGVLFSQCEAVCLQGNVWKTHSGLLVKS